MDIEELKKEKQILESKINNLICSFADKYKVDIECVDINIIHLCCQGMGRHETGCIGVNTKVRIEI